MSLVAAPIVAAARVVAARVVAARFVAAARVVDDDAAAVADIAAPVRTRADVAPADAPSVLPSPAPAAAFHVNCSPWANTGWWAWLTASELLPMPVAVAAVHAVLLSMYAPAADHPPAVIAALPPNMATLVCMA